MALSPDIKTQLNQYLAMLESDIQLQAHLGDDEQSKKCKNS